MTRKISRRSPCWYTAWLIGAITQLMSPTITVLLSVSVSLHPEQSIISCWVTNHSVGYKLINGACVWYTTCIRKVNISNYSSTKNLIYTLINIRQNYTHNHRSKQQFSRIQFSIAFLTSLGVLYSEVDKSKKIINSLKFTKLFCINL